jgi:hypothetical protein
MSTALRTVLIPLRDLLETVLGHKIDCSIEEDNSAAHRIAEVGFSSALSYMDKTHRIAVSFNHETCERLGIPVTKVGTKEQRADGLTKEFGPGPWGDVLKMMNIS